MFVLMEEMHRIGVKTNIILLSLTLISSILFSKEIVVHEINKIENITLINGSSITQGGLTIISDEHLLVKSRSRETNNSISQGVVVIDDENITYDIVNIISEYPIEEN